jgi:hypothetical protein
MKPIVSMREALDDPALLGTILEGSSWEAWRVVLIAALGETLTSAEREIFARLSGGRAAEPGELIEELWAVVGRRGGKTRAAATLASYLASLCDHSAITAPGVRPIVLFLAQNQKQAAVAFGYCCGIFDSVPMLSELVVNRTADTLSLSTGIDLMIRAASARGLRGITCAAVLADECAFWTTDENSTNADTEILHAVRPTLATTGGPLIVVSSPYARRGEFYQTYVDHYGAKGDKRILVVQGASRDFNASLPQSVVDRALKRDPAAASAEYLGLFRGDIEGFVSREAVESCTVKGRVELPSSGERYVGFVDVSGGMSDSHCCGVAYMRDGVATLAAAREIKGGDVESVVAEFAGLLRTYDLTDVWSDRYGASWTYSAFQRAGIRLQYSPKTRSDLYLELLPALHSKQVELLDLPRLHFQLLALQRRTTTSGRDVIDHPSGGHDDLANACAGALVMAAASGSRPRFLAVSVEPWRSSSGRLGETPEELDRIASIICGRGNTLRDRGIATTFEGEQ